MANENTPAYNADLSHLESLMQYTPAMQFMPSYLHDPLGNWFEGITGNLTEADYMRMNEERYRDALAFQREFKSNLFLDSTEMQRKVADYAAAGINPYALAGQSVSAPSVSAGASALGAGRGPSLSLSDLIGLASLPSQIKNMKAQRDVLESEKELNESKKSKIESETEGQNLSNILFRDTLEIKKVLLGDEHDAYQWKKEVAERTVAASERANEIKADANTIMQQQANAYTAQVDSMMELMKEQSLTESVKRQELRALAREANASADYRSAMKALDENIKKSQDKLLQEDLKIAAAEARLKNGVYTDEYIKALGQITGAEADMKQALAEYNRGDYHSASKSMQRMFREMEKQGYRGSWSVGSPYFSMSETAPSSMSPR